MMVGPRAGIDLRARKPDQVPQLAFDGLAVAGDQIPQQIAVGLADSPLGFERRPRVLGPGFRPDYFAEGTHILLIP